MFLLYICTHHNYIRNKDAFATPFSVSVTHLFREIRYTSRYTFCTNSEHFCSNLCQDPIHKNKQSLQDDTKLAAYSNSLLLDVSDLTFWEEVFAVGFHHESCLYQVHALHDVCKFKDKYL